MLSCSIQASTPNRRGFCRGSDETKRSYCQLRQQCSQLTSDYIAEMRQSIPGLTEMLEKEPQRWLPTFKDIAVQTDVGARATLDMIHKVPTMVKQAQEAALQFLEGGLVSGAFSGILAFASRQIVEGMTISHDSTNSSYRSRESSYSHRDVNRRCLESDLPTSIVLTSSDPLEEGRLESRQKVKRVYETKGLPGLTALINKYQYDIESRCSRLPDAIKGDLHSYKQFLQASFIDGYTLAFAEALRQRITYQYQAMPNVTGPPKLLHPDL